MERGAGRPARHRPGEKGGKKSGKTWASFFAEKKRFSEERPCALCMFLSTLLPADLGLPVVAAVLYLSTYAESSCSGLPLVRLGYVRQ
jgi:hypothetical protein